MCCGSGTRRDAVILLGHPWYIRPGLHHPDNCRFPVTKQVSISQLLPDLPVANELTDYLSVQQRKLCLIDHVSDDFSMQRCSNAKRVLMGFIHHAVCWTHWCNFLIPRWQHARLLVTCVPWVHFINLSNSRWILGVFNDFKIWTTFYICSLSSKRPLIARFMGLTWGRQDPGGPHVGPMNFAIWDCHNYNASAMELPQSSAKPSISNIMLFWTMWYIWK